MKQNKSPRRSQIILIGAIWLFFFLALNSMVRDSPTMDEQNHIARGIAYLRTGDPRLSVEHPPLVNVLGALPLLTIPNLQLPLDQPSWQGEPPGVFWYFFADQFLWEYNPEYVPMIIFLTRLPIVFLTIGLALVGYSFAREMWGRPSAAMAFMLLLFDPNIIAHGRYMTTDLGGTFFIFLALYLIWRLWRSSPMFAARFWWAALVLGLAFASKLSTLIFVPLLIFLALLPSAYFHGAALSPLESLPFSLRARRRLTQLAVVGILALLVVWAVFGFEWGSYQFQSDWLAQFNRFQGPLPTYFTGIEQILFLNSGGRTAFLLGKTNMTGFWLYFPVAFAVKTPLPTLLALLGALFWLLRQKTSRFPALFLLFAASFYFITTLQSSLNIGYRHLLPILPFLYLLIAGLAVVRGRAGLWAKMLGWGAVVALVGVTIWIHPHYLSFFNQPAGGPANGHRILIDSNVDWGQDLLRLGDWLNKNDIEMVKLGWFGTARPAYYGIQYSPLPGLGGVGQPPFYDAWWDPPFDPQAPQPGVYVISATSLQEFPLVEKSIYAWFRDRQPTARIGYSIFIYDLHQ